MTAPEIDWRQDASVIDLLTHLGDVTRNAGEDLITETMDGIRVDPRRLAYLGRCMRPTVDRLAELATGDAVPAVAAVSTRLDAFTTAVTLTPRAIRRGDRVDAKATLDLVGQLDAAIVDVSRVAEFTDAP